MTRKSVTGAVALSTAAVLGCGTAAFAQTSTSPSSTEYQAQGNFYGRGKNTSVMERERPDYEAVGIHEGGLTLYPQIAVEGIFSSNVFATQNDTKSDEYFVIKPSITAQSNWGRHGLRLYAEVMDTQYTRFTSENETTYQVRADGRVDVHGQSTINVGVDAEHQFEQRGNVYAITNLAHPVTYDTQGIYARGSLVQDRLRITLGGEARNYDYANTSLQGGGFADEQSRDSHIWDVSARADYAISPDTAVFGSVTTGKINYVQTIDFTRRDSDNIQVLGGVNFDLTSLARGEIGLGYSRREYASDIYKGLEGFSAGVKLEYFPTTHLTVTLLAQRRPQDAAFNQSGGFFSNSASLGADYELRRNWIVSGSAGYETDDFVGLQRHDQVANVVVSSRYYFSRFIGVGLDVAYANRDSSGAFAGPAFSYTTVGLSLVFQR